MRRTPNFFIFKKSADFFNEQTLSIPQLTVQSYCEKYRRDCCLESQYQVNKDENGNELHFILLLLILLICHPVSEENDSDLRRQLIFAKELSVPIPKVNLINGGTLQNVIVKEVLTDLVIFQNPLNNLRSNVALSSIVSWGAF